MLAKYRKWRRRRILERHAIPEDLWQRTIAALDVLAPLERDELEALRELTVMFLYEKPFYGAHGLVVSEAMRVCIAAQACLPVLNLGLDWYRGWRTVLIYEGAFVAHHVYEDESGLVHEEASALDGETSWQGSVILSWEEVAAGADRADDDDDDDDDGNDVDTFPNNVVIHEFAHKLDYLNGDANGFPPLPSELPAGRWSAVFSAAYDAFCALVDAGEPTPFDDYAAENPAEFFAVTSEVFFVAPLRLRQAFPDVYSVLSLFYRQDPAARLSRVTQSVSS